MLGYCNALFASIAATWYAKVYPEPVTVPIALRPLPLRSSFGTPNRVARKDGPGPPGVVGCHPVCGNTPDGGQEVGRIKVVADARPTETATPNCPVASPPEAALHPFCLKKVERPLHTIVLGIAIQFT